MVKTLMRGEEARRPQAGLPSGVAEPAGLDFLRSKSPPRQIWFPELVQRPACALGLRISARRR